MRLMTKRIAVIRVRGTINKEGTVKDTLRRLNLHHQNYCVILEERSELMGMVTKVKDTVTWGPIQPSVEKELQEKRTEKNIRTNKAKPFYRLHPPQKGYGRKGIKKHFSIKGALGDRGEKINDLIKRMI